MSGGVDSTVTAYLLQKAGHEVIGVNFNFTRNKRDGDDISRGRHSVVPCMGEFYEPELEEIASKLKIKIIYKDYACEFRNKIINYFVTEYEHGRTPNPCALCNPTMKFAKLIEVMKEENCDMIATGHYAKVGESKIVGDDILSSRVGSSTASSQAFVGASSTSPHRYYIQKSSNQKKDQSYMLYRLTQEQLSHIIFPLGDMDKNDVRKIAAELGLKVADKKDSQDVCFIEASKIVGDDILSSHVGASIASPLDYKEYIKRYEFGNDYREKIALGLLKEDEILSKPYFKKGEFVDLSGKVLGYHNGIVNYTIGQRKGLNIAFGERKFVVRIDSEKNQVVLGSNDDLMSTEFKMKDVVFSGHDENIIGKKFYAKLRYRHDGTLCEIREVASDCKGKLCDTNATCRGEHCEPESTIYTCHLLEPVRAITPGQSAVFYDDEGRVMFGGIIA